MIGLDVDRKGIGRRVADTASDYGVDNLNVSFLTPLPGTRLWAQMERRGAYPLTAFRRTGSTTRYLPGGALPGLVSGGRYRGDDPVQPQVLLLAPHRRQIGAQPAPAPQSPHQPGAQPLLAPQLSAAGQGL